MNVTESTLCEKMCSSNKNQKPHAIMVSFHLQGHIIPFVNLAIKLASKGFSITFAHTEHIHHQISNSQYNSTEIDFFSPARESGLDIHYTTISDGFPVTFNRAANFDQVLDSFVHKFPDKVDEFVGNVIKSRSCSSSSYFLIADTFCVWSEKIANKHGLVNVSFWTEPALVFSLYYHLELLKQNGDVPVNGRTENIDYVPGVKSISTKDLMSYLQDSELALIHKVVFSAFDVVKRADFILCNTVESLEKEPISALQHKQPFYAIGPIFPADFGDNSIPKSLLPEYDCTEWLHAKRVRSVLYISFGSLGKAEKNVILEIASGILLSEVNFIWVLRPGSVDLDGGDIYGILPEGFAERTKERGVIVPWCSQNLVLSNPAIGGFLTHCGWNSILETIWCGVPMLCYPLFTDQLTNRKLVVDDWRIGLNLCDGGVIRCEEVAEKIRSLMSGKRSNELKREIGNVRKILQSALDVDGSSEKHFDCFIEDVLAEVQKRCEKNVI